MSHQPLSHAFCHGICIDVCRSLTAVCAAGTTARNGVINQPMDYRLLIQQQKNSCSAWWTRVYYPHIPQHWSKGGPTPSMSRGLAKQQHLERASFWSKVSHARNIKKYAEVRPDGSSYSPANELHLLLCPRITWISFPTRVERVRFGLHWNNCSYLRRQLPEILFTTMWRQVISSQRISQLGRIENLEENVV